MWLLLPNPTLPNPPRLLPPRRRLRPASGFYEWDKKQGSKQPHFIYRVDAQPLVLAGLWERWEDQERGEVIEACTILTTDALPEGSQDRTLQHIAAATKGPFSACYFNLDGPTLE